MNQYGSISSCETKMAEITLAALLSGSNRPPPFGDLGCRSGSGLVFLCWSSSSDATSPLGRPVLVALVVGRGASVVVATNPSRWLVVEHECGRLGSLQSSYVVGPPVGPPQLPVGLACGASTGGLCCSELGLRLALLLPLLPLLRRWSPVR